MKKTKKAYDGVEIVNKINIKIKMAWFNYHVTQKLLIIATKNLS